MTKQANIIAVIPARYQSSRFPGKPLVDIDGKSMIQRVYEQAKKANLLKEVIIATDDNRIATHAKEFGAAVQMTGEHSNGTSRCLEAIEKSNLSADFIINIQGDEPFIKPEQIDQLASTLSQSVEIASMAKQITDQNTLFDPNSVKVIFNQKGNAQYFSRNPIPYVQSTKKEDWLAKGTFYKHIGLYAYRRDILTKITQLPSSPLEELEKLEQLRWLHHDINIKMAITTYESKGIDTPEDLKKSN